MITKQSKTHLSPDISILPSSGTDSAGCSSASCRNLLASLSLKEKCDLVCGADFWHSAAIDRLHIPALQFSDGPHGLRTQISEADHLGLHKSVKATCFPTASALANSWNPAMAVKIGQALGREAAALDVDVLLGPGMNIIRNPRGGRNFEYYSEDPYLTGEMAAGMVKGISRYVGACPKHFLLNSQETSRMSIDERADEKTLHELYLPAFQRVIQENPDWIMTSYNKVEGTYASQSALVYDLLKQMGYHGATITDWGGGWEIDQAVQAGSTLEMPGTRGQSARALKQAIDNGTISESDLDKRVLEMLEAVHKTQRRKANPRPRPDAFHHHILAVQAAMDSMVLLQNDGILPLGRRTIAWIGPFDLSGQKAPYPLQGFGSSRVEPARNIPFSLLAATSSLQTIGYAEGYELDGHFVNRRLEEKALQLAEKADVVIFLCALPKQEQLEGMDRRARAIPACQVHLYQKLLKTGRPVILVDAIAGPVEIPDHEKFAAVLYTGLAGQGAKEALLRVMSGAGYPGGFLAQTFAYSWRDHPSSACFPKKDGISTREEGMHVGYRAFLDKKVMYPFGFGLGYTTFEIRNVELHLQTIDTSFMTAEVLNTGAYSGAYLGQIYVRKPGCDYIELVGFQKVELNPHISKTLHIPISALAFQSYDVELHDWQTIDKPFEISFASSSKDMIATWQISISLNGEPEVNDKPEAGDPVWLSTPVSAEKSSQNTETEKVHVTKQTEMSAENQTNQAVINQALEGINSSDSDRTEDSGFGSDYMARKKQAAFNVHHEPAVSYGMDTPIHALKDCPDFFIRNLSRRIGWTRNKSLQANKPSLLAISLYDMPLKGLAKLSPELFTMPMMEALLRQIQNPSLKNIPEIIKGALDR